MKQKVSSLVPKALCGPWEQAQQERLSDIRLGTRCKKKNLKL